MIRVIAGSARGRRLLSPRGSRIRPTSAKVREAIFSILSTSVRGARVVDLYCGVGALGIEALSRGAAHCTFVDESGRLLATVRQNLELAGVAEQGRTLKRRLPEGLASGFATATATSLDLIFSDPPYSDGSVVELARRLGRLEEVVAGQTLWVHELASGRLDRERTAQLPGWTRVDTRRYGSTGLWFLQADPSQGA